MQIYNYVAKDQNGETLRGKVEARDEKQAAEILRQRKMVIIDIKSIAASSSFSVITDLFERVKSEDLVAFTQQLATMINAGLPLSEALQVLSVQSKPRMAREIAEISRDIQGGTNLADALARRKGMFSDIYVASVRAGEAAGKLDEILHRLAETEEKQREFATKTKGALVYPVIVIIAMFLVMMVLMVMVIPKLTEMYKDFGAELPFITQVLIAVSNFFRYMWWAIIGGIFGGIVIVKRWYATGPGRYAIDKLMLNMPVFGPLRGEIILTDFARTLALLVGAGVSILEGLEIVSKSTGNIIYQKAFEEAAKGVEKGLPLATMLARQQVFPPLLPQMISVGEETGELQTVLNKVSHFFESEAEAKVKNLTTALEPLIMIVLGVGVGFLVLAIIQPIYQLTNQF